MIFPVLNRDGVEIVYGSFYNSNASTAIPADGVVGLDFSTPDGVKIVQPTTANLNAVVGVANASIAASSYGLVQIYGYRATSKVLLTDTTLAQGLKLTPVNAQDYLGSLAAADGRDGFFVLLESHTTGSGTVSKKIHIRAM